MIYGHWCTHFEASVCTFQGVYANYIKIGIYTQKSQGIIRRLGFFAVALRIEPRIRKDLRISELPVFYHD